MTGERRHLGEEGAARVFGWGGAGVEFMGSMRRAILGFCGPNVSMGLVHFIIHFLDLSFHSINTTYTSI